MASFFKFLAGSFDVTLSAVNAVIIPIIMITTIISINVNPFELGFTANDGDLITIGQPWLYLG